MKNAMKTFSEREIGSLCSCLRIEIVGRDISMRILRNFVKPKIIRRKIFKVNIAGFNLLYLTF